MNGKTWIKQIYFTAGFVNIIGIPIFTKLFTNEYLIRIDPVTFSKTGLITIILWGLAYISVAKYHKEVPYISLVFSIEKFFYGTVWIIWIKNHYNEITSIFNNDILTGIFYSVYGLNDLLFGVFFLYVYIVCKNK